MTVWPRRRRRDRCDELPIAPILPAPPGSSIYRDGTYLISVWGEARTWAVCSRGRWGVVYEWLGDQPLAGWVDAEQIPLEVRALALRREGVR